MGLGDEGVQDWEIGLGGVRTESFKVEADGGLAVLQRGIVSISFADHDALQAERVGHVPVGMFLHNDLPSFHAIKIVPQNLEFNLLLRKNTIKPNERKNMNNQFDKLTKNLAESVTRRAALKKFGVGLAGMALACFGLANRAKAGKIDLCTPCMNVCLADGFSKVYCRKVRCPFC
jgi:hypothetical protein